VVGASVGAVLGTALLAALAAIFFLYRKLGSARGRYTAFEHGSAQGKMGGNLVGGVYEISGNPRHEMPAAVSININNQ
jgi:hypothetical protein